MDSHDDLAGHVPDANGQCAGCRAAGYDLPYPCAFVALAAYVGPSVEHDADGRWRVQPEPRYHTPRSLEQPCFPWERPRLPDIY